MPETLSADHLFSFLCHSCVLDTGEGAADFGATARVRPVVTVTIAKE